jgi:hypothetical protein
MAWPRGKSDLPGLEGAGSKELPDAQLVATATTGDDGGSPPKEPLNEALP